MESRIELIKSNSYSFGCGDASENGHNPYWEQEYGYGRDKFSVGLVNETGRGTGDARGDGSHLGEGYGFGREGSFWREKGIGDEFCCGEG